MSVGLVEAACNCGGSNSSGASNPSAVTTDDTESDSESATETETDTLGSASGEGSTTGPPVPVEVDCGTLPAGAVGANYSHTPAAMGGSGIYTWSAQDLPPDMSINPVTGEISGFATTEGVYDVVISATDGANPPGVGMQTCAIAVGPQLNVDLSNNAKPCIDESTDLLDFISGGDGSPITCTVEIGQGAGTLPDGITVNDSSCMIEGSITETRYGTWVWMVEAEQSELKLYVPYCATQATQDPGAYTISADHSGGTNNELVPAVGTFDTDNNLAFGGGGDPAFTVLGPCGNNSCFFAFLFAVTSSPFGANCNDPNPPCGCMVMGNPACYGLGPANLLNDGNGNPIGFTHEMFANGGLVPEALSDRMWVLNWELTYCISDTAAPCDGAANVEANSEGNLQFGTIMVPQ